MEASLQSAWGYLSTQGVDIGLKIVGAIVAWVIGRWLIGMATRAMGAVMERAKKLDITLINYLKSIVSVLLNRMLNGVSSALLPS